MINLFPHKSKGNKTNTDTLKVDIHSHLIPGIDDGAESIQESISLIKALADLGYQKLITTPHIMTGQYNNTPKIITDGLSALREEIEKQAIPVEIAAAAEYYLDEYFLEMITKEKLLTFGNNYLLFETSTRAEPAGLAQTIFELQAGGYKPVLAHPERYSYIISNPKKAQELHEKGVLLQVNINSLGGYYSRTVQKTAEKLLDMGIVNFLGSDCHGKKHIDYLTKTMSGKPFQKALTDHKLLNNSLV